MKRLIVSTCAILAVTFLNACGSEPADSTSQTGDHGTAVTSVVLSDGTTCRVMDGTAAALWCDWQGPRATVVTDKPQGDNGTGIEQVTLRNGVHCAGMVSRAGDSQNKGLSCNWQGARIEAGQRPAEDPTVSGTAVTVVSFADGTECAVMDGPGAALDCGKATA